MKKVGMFDRIFDSLSLLFKNPVLFIPDILFFLVTTGLLLLFVYINNLVPNLNLGSSSLTEQITNQIQTLFSESSSIVKLVISFVTLLIVNVVIGLTLINIRYTMIRNLLTKKKVNLKIYFESKKYTLSLVAIKIMLFFLYAIPLIILIPFFTGLTNSSLVGGILLALLYAMFYIVFFFVYPVLYLGGTRNPFKVMKGTFGFCRRNLRYSLMTIVVVLFVSIFIGVFSSYVSTNLTSLFANITVAWLNWIFVGLLVLFLKLIDITLSLWVKVFSFVSYKTRV